jgi:hypothetical protein
MSQDGGATVIPLNLEKLDSFSLFPGQVRREIHSPFR